MTRVRFVDKTMELPDDFLFQFQASAYEFVRAINLKSGDTVIGFGQVLEVEIHPTPIYDEVLQMRIKFYEAKNKFKFYEGLIIFLIICLFALLCTKW